MILRRSLQPAQKEKRVELKSPALSAYTIPASIALAFALLRLGSIYAPLTRTAIVVSCSDAFTLRQDAANHQSLACIWVFASCQGLCDNSLMSSPLSRDQGQERKKEDHVLAKPGSSSKYSILVAVVLDSMQAGPSSLSTMSPMAYLYKGQSPFL